MTKKKEKARQATVQFSPARFKRLPMAEKLAYLRAAFGALGGGLEVVERRGQEKRPQPPPVGGPIRRLPRLPLIRMLSRAEFNQLSMDQKLAYLSRTHRTLREAAKKWGLTPSST